MKLELTHIAITGFKGYKDKVEYDLGYRTIITGDNGLGKTTIGEAIVWCLTGCDIWGNEKAATRLVNNKKPKVTEVVLDFLLDEDPQTIIRRKKGSGNDLYWNEAKVTTNDIARDIFKNKNVFLSIANPYYFPELAPKDAKQLLSDVLKPIASTDIFAELGDYLSKVLNDNGFRLADTFLQDAMADLKEQEENIIYLEGVQSHINEEMKDIKSQQKRAFDDTELKKLQKELESLKNIDNVDVELSKLQKPKDFISELSELRVEEATLKASLNTLSLQELLPVEAKKERKEELLRQYHNKKAQLDFMESKFVECDKCGNSIDLTKETKEMLKVEIKEICSAGVKLKDEIKEIEAKNAEIIENNTKIKANKKAEVSQQLKKIESKRQLFLAQAEADKQEYEEKRQAILSKKEKTNAEYLYKLNYLEHRIQSLEEDKEEILRLNASIDAAISHNEKLVKDKELNEEKIKNSKNKIEQLKVAIDAAKQYNSIKLKKQFNQIKPYLDKVEINFEKLTKDGELKEDFKVLYEGKEFNKLSDAQKIKASLEISNLLINAQNLHFPIFIDRAESINIIPEIDTQMIQAKVTKDSEIKVEVIS